MALRVLSLTVAVVLAVGALPASATADEASSAEFVLQRDSVVVGNFGGYGGQLNQHVYAKISGPPPGLATMESKVVALRPQLVRVFFNTSEWTDEDRMESFLRTVKLAERADADVNITWQGSSFEFAMRNMPRFADELAALLQRHGIERLWVTMFNEPNTTARTLAEYEQVYRSLHRLLVERGVRDRIRFMGGDLTRSEQGPSQAEWLRYMASRMGDLLDAWSVHVYWDFWDTEKIDQRLLAEVRSIVSTIPPEQHRPIYVTEFGVRGLATFEGEASFDPGFWPDGRGMSATEMSAFQHAWFNLRAAQLGYSGTVKWDLYPAKYDAGTQDFSALGSGAEGWPARPVYNLLHLLTRTTEPRGGHIADVTAGPAADRRKLVTAYVSPANDITILGLHKTGAGLSTTSHAPVPYTIGGLPANRFFRLLVWNGSGRGTNVDAGFVATDGSGALAISIPRDAVFALTTTPIMTLPW
jgi:Glycosyl hydrolase catalytic core